MTKGFLTTSSPLEIKTTIRRNRSGCFVCVLKKAERMLQADEQWCQETPTALLLNQESGIADLEHPFTTSLEIIRLKVDL
jgi:hypothetical protein